LQPSADTHRRSPHVAKAAATERTRANVNAFLKANPSATVAEVAAGCEISKGYASRIIKGVEAATSAPAPPDEIKAKRDRELAAIDWAEAEARKAWELSLTPNEVKTLSDSDKFGKTRTVQTMKGFGNPKFLAIVIDCVESRRAMLGLDAPKELIVSLRVQDQLGDEVAAILIAALEAEAYERRDQTIVANVLAGFRRGWNALRERTVAALPDPSLVDEILDVEINGEKSIVEL
jgi:hypothetical protein